MDLGIEFVQLDFSADIQQSCRNHGDKTNCLYSVKIVPSRSLFPSPLHLGFYSVFVYSKFSAAIHIVARSGVVHKYTEKYYKELQSATEITK